MEKKNYWAKYIGPLICRAVLKINLLKFSLDQNNIKLYWLKIMSFLIGLHLKWAATSDAAVMSLSSSWA
jgi:hypothetical protein